MECRRVERREFLVFDDPPHPADEEILRQGNVRGDRRGSPAFGLTTPMQGIWRSAGNQIDYRLDRPVAAVGQSIGSPAHANTPSDARSLFLAILTCQPNRRQRADHRSTIDRKERSVRVDLLLGLVSQLRG